MRIPDVSGDGGHGSHSHGNEENHKTHAEGTPARELVGEHTTRPRHDHAEHNR